MASPRMTIAGIGSLMPGMVAVAWCSAITAVTWGRPESVAMTFESG